MADLMTFPNTVEEFMEQYKIVDTEQVYTNGAELVPIFRMKQWFEHLPTADAVEMKKEGEWEMFDLISSAYYGKGMYFKQDDGTVYSRYSCKYMSVDEAIREFVSLIDGTEANDGEIH